MAQGIEIEIGPPKEVDPYVLEGQEQIALEEDGMMGEFSPQGNFSKKPLNTLVKQTRALQPLFGLNADYPEFKEDIETFPPEFTRLLVMFKQAIDDAITKDIVDDGNTFQLEEITDDKSLQLLAGKLGAVARDKKFKKFLEQPEELAEEPAMEEETQTIDEERTPLPEGSDESIDELFMERL
jgi:hypothetical protein|tara:strand:- start:727 stop:1272 length:546 start_codon:yes stop_codon:yes gene_type:complete